MKEQNIYEILAKNIRGIRSQSGLTIEELAEKAQISVSFLSYIETKKKKPSLSTIYKIAQALSIQISDLFVIEKTNKKYTHKEIESYLHKIYPRYKENLIKIISEIIKNYREN